MVVTSGRYRWTGEQCSFWGKGNIPYLDLWNWAAVYLVYVKVKLTGTKLASACQARGFQGSERVPLTPRCWPCPSHRSLATRDRLLETLASVPSSSVLVAAVRETECFFGEKIPTFAGARCPSTEPSRGVCCGRDRPASRCAWVLRLVLRDGAACARAPRGRRGWDAGPARWGPRCRRPVCLRAEGALGAPRRCGNCDPPPPRFPQAPPDTAGPQSRAWAPCRGAVPTPRRRCQKRPAFRMMGSALRRRGSCSVAEPA